VVSTAGRTLPAPQGWALCTPLKSSTAATLQYSHEHHSPVLHLIRTTRPWDWPKKQPYISYSTWTTPSTAPDLITVDTGGSGKCQYSKHGRTTRLPPTSPSTLLAWLNLRDRRHRPPGHAHDREDLLFPETSSIYVRLVQATRDLLSRMHSASSSSLARIVRHGKSAKLCCDNPAGYLLDRLSCLRHLHHDLHNLTAYGLGARRGQ